MYSDWGYNLFVKPIDARHFSDGSIHRHKMKIFHFMRSQFRILGAENTSARKLAAIKHSVQ
jgi:hypothetical protein